MRALSPLFISSEIDKIPSVIPRMAEITPTMSLFPFPFQILLGWQHE